jgi:multiple sugar transport system substrate-binding protein
MKKTKLVAALGIAALMGGLAGCSSGSGGGSGSGPVTITFWNGFTAADKPNIEKIVSDFNKSQSKVKVEMTIEPWDTLYEKLLPAYAAGNGPTLVGMDQGQFPGYASKGVLRPMDDFYKSWSDSKNLRKANIDATLYKGANYGVPMTGSTCMLYYNKKLLQADGITTLPTTLDELGQDVVKLTHYNAASPTSSTYGFDLPDNNGVETWISLMQADGGGVVSSDGTKSVLDSSGSVKAVDYWSNLIINDHVSPVGLSGVDGDNLFAAGKAAFYVNGPWASGTFKQAGIDFGLMSVPKGSVAQASPLNSDNFGVDKKATDAQVQAAETFIKWFDSPKEQTYYSVNTGTPPIRTDITEKQLSVSPTAIAFSKAVGATPSYPQQVNFAQMDANVFLPTIQKIENGKGTAADLLPPASKQIDSLIVKK